VHPPPAEERQRPQAARAPVPPQAGAHRYHELDWLRVFIILALVPAHAMGFFTANTGTYLGTQYSSPIALSTLMSLGTWGMALLFLVAGAASSAMLARRRPRQFLRERCVRLFIPFMFATLTLVPLQDYVMIRTFPHSLDTVPVPPSWDPHAAGSPVSFYLWFLGAYASFLIPYSPQYAFIFWSHLWFIPHLLVISLLTLPLLLFLRGPHGTRLIAWLADCCDRQRGALFLLAVPLALLNVVLGWQWQGWQVVGAPDAVNLLSQFLFYTFVYVYGFVLYSDERLRQSARRDGNAFVLALAVLVFAITQIPGMGSQALAHDYSVGGITSALLRGVAAWMGIVALAGLSMRFLDFTNRRGQYLSEASYPFYVLHLAVLYLVGLPLLASGVPAVLGFLAMVVLTYALTLAAYEVLVRHIQPMRLLFGVKKAPQSWHPPWSHAIHDPAL
jgi:glucan biosynthesis protein C